MNKQKKNIRLMDGSMCAQLKKFGYDAYEHRPHWTLDANSDTELMKKVYSTYVDMNVDIVTTNTYHQGSTLDKNLPEDQQNREKYDKLLQKTCAVAQEVVWAHNRVDPHKIVLMGSVGTLAVKYHDCSEYNGRYVDVKNAMDIAYNYFYTIFLMFEKKTCVRRLIIETIPTELEGRAILQLLNRFPTFTVVISFTFKENGLLRHGETIHNLAEKMIMEPRVVGVGINCTDPANVLPALQQLAPYGFGDIFVYPNIGDQHFQSDQDLVGSPFNKKLVHSWIKNGATVIGGCCGVDDNHLRGLKAILDEYNKNSN